MNIVSNCFFFLGKTELIYIHYFFYDANQTSKKRKQKSKLDTKKKFQLRHFLENFEGL